MVDNGVVRGRSLRGRTVAGLIAAGLCSAASAQPNIILFFVDDMGAADWEFHTELNPTGSRVYETPNMLRLAERGVTFTNGYSSSPVCSPARSALMTGKSAANIGITDFIGAGSNASGALVRTTQSWIQNMPAEEVLLPEALFDAGYRTAFFGKWHLGQDQNPAANPLASGFEVNFGGRNAGNPGFAGGFFAGADGAWAGMPGLNVPGSYPADAYLSDVLSMEAADYIAERAAADEPFFAMMSHYVVHTPIQAPAPLVTYYQNKINSLTPAEIDGHTDATYAAMVQKMDESLGRILDALIDPNGDGSPDDSIFDETVIVFTADNGGLTNFSITSNRPFRDGKGSIYEGGIREPLIVAYTADAKIGRGVTTDANAVGYDLYPTILDLAGVDGDADQNAAMDGTSLRPALENVESASLNDRDLYFHYPHRSPQAASNNLPVSGGSWVSAVRRGDEKLIYFYDERRFERYNLAVDPSESNDLFNADPMASAPMSRSLYGHLRRVDAPMPRDIGSERELPSSAIVAASILPEGEAEFTDVFEATRDYKASGVGDSGFTGPLNADAASVLDADLTTPGSLTFRNAGSTRFVAGDISAPALYREVTGDFEATMRIASQDSVDFHVLAMLVADPVDVENEFLWVGQQNRAGANDFAQARSIVDGTRLVDVGESGVYPYYRLAREDNTFVGFFSADGVVWVPFVEFDRPDLPETVWLGLTQASFGSSTVTGAIDEFQIVAACDVDLADPEGLLTFADVRAFLFGAKQSPFFDVISFLQAFDAGCGL